MSYSVTYDEKATGFFSSNASAYADAPFSLSTPYTLAQATTAYGLLTATGYVADSDAYTMGILLNGTYSVSASNAYWFFGTGYSSFSTPSIAIYNSVGTSVASNSFGGVSFNVTTPGTYYAVVSGATYQSSQYALSYSYTQPQNYVATSNLTISGNASSGNVVSVIGSYYDANGTSTSTPITTWFVDLQVVATGSSYTIRSADAGKVLIAVVQFYDDAGFLETLNSPSAVRIASAAPSYSIASSVSSVNEGGSVTYTVTTTNVASGTQLAYTLSGTGITTADIGGAALTGTTTVGSNGSATFTVNLAADQLTEGAETLTATVQGQTRSVTVNDTSTTPVPTYSLTASASSTSESGVVTFTVVTTNVAANTVLSYTLSGSGITTADIGGASLTGTTTVAANGTASFTVNLTADHANEGAETLTATVQGHSVSVLVSDTSTSLPVLSNAYLLAAPYPQTGNDIVDVTTNGYRWYFRSGQSKILNWSVSDSAWRHTTLQSAETQADFTTLFGNISEFIDVGFNFLGYVSGNGVKAGYEVAYDKGSDLNISYSYNGITPSGAVLNDGFFGTSTARTAFCNFPDLDGTYANVSYVGAAGDTWLNYNNSFITTFTYELGTKGFALLLHEVLHGLGLKHTFDDGTTGRPTYQSLGASSFDRQWVSVMSYDKVENGGDGAYVGSQPISPMIFDAIALQYLYGESNLNAGNTTYDLTSYVGNYFNCQWDASGNDILDGGGLSFGIEANLGTASESNGTNTHHVGYITSTLDSLFIGIQNPSKWTWLWGEYENINGTGYADNITGNDLDNTINGGGGDDVLIGGIGNDVFDWDANLRGGNDTFEGGLGDDTYVLDSRMDVIHESPFEGVDTVFVGFDYSLVGTNLENLKTFNNQSTGIRFTGNSWANDLEGGLGNDTLVGNEGDDTLIGGGGNDSISGGVGSGGTVVFSGLFSQYTITLNGTGSYVVSDSVAGRDGVDSVQSVEWYRFSDRTLTAAQLLAPVATYAMGSSTVSGVNATSVNEDATVNFNVNTTNVASGTSLTYTLSGVSAADVTGGSLTGTVTVGADGKAVIPVSLVADQLTENAETLTVTVQGQSASVTVNDTSTTPVPTYSLAASSASGGCPEFCVNGFKVNAVSSVHRTR